MAELDPNIILQAKQPQIASPFDLASGAMQLRNLGLQGQNQQITLEQNQRALQDQKTIADLYRANTLPDGSVNHAGVVQGLAQAGLGDKIPAYQQGVATASKDMTAADAAQFDLHKKKLDITANAISSLLSKPDVNQDDVIGAITGLVSNGIIDANTGAQMARQIPGRPEQLRPFLMQKGLETMDVSKQLDARIAMAPKYNEQDTGAAINEGTVDPLTGQRTAGTTNVVKSMTPDQAAKIRLATSGALTDDAKSFMIDRLLNGEKASAVLGNLGRGQQGAADLRDVMNRLPQVAAQRGIGGAQLANIMQNTAADARTLTELGAREGKIAPRVQELSTFADQAREASAAVPRGNWTDMSSILQFGAKHSSDAALAKLQTAVDGVINARAAAIGGGVIHVGDQIAGHHLLAATQGPDAFNAVIDQFKYEASGALAAPGQVRERINTAAGRGAAPSNSAPPVPVKSDADYASLKSGTRFLAPDGSTRVKP
jgi:hypothetical protein